MRCSIILIKVQLDLLLSQMLAIPQILLMVWSI
nr:MAG TPA: hypothetical protein [Caudoviricetes sp.]